MPARAHPFPCLDQLERRYDGPIPPADPAALDRPCPEARARLFARLAAEARMSAARRRSRLSAGAAPRDTRLGELTRAIHFYRRQGIAWGLQRP